MRMACTIQKCRRINPHGAHLGPAGYTGAGRQFLFLLLNGLHGNTVLWCLRAQPHEAEQPDIHCYGQITNPYSTDSPFFLVPAACPSLLPSESLLLNESVA